MKDHFYKDLDSFSDFNQITKSHHFREVPEDWFVIVTDIKNSTRAIEQGRYKDVNILGAASIATVRNSLKEDDFPFVFGGDGTTILVPKNQVKKLKESLAGLKKRAIENFDLELRVGVVPVHDLYAQGYPLEVAKYEINYGKCVAILRGLALQQVEKWIRQEGSPYEISPSPETNASFAGLSCRWNKIPSQWGQILSLIVVSRQTDSEQVYDKILARLDEIVADENHDLNPVNVAEMEGKTLQECLNCEQRYHKSLWSVGYVLRFVEICVVRFIFHFQIPGLFGLLKYKPKMRTHSDYRKFDDMLRMVIDCSSLQVDAIKAMLSDMLDRGEIYYGLHESDASLLTCFVQSTKDGDHIHFVDGSDGGYSKAASQLKQQMA